MHNNQAHAQFQARSSFKGFTLLELAVVLIIIALLLGAVVKGSSLVNDARMRNVLATIGNHQISIENFYDLYLSYPGDFTQATVFWPTVSTAVDGDGSGLVDPGPSQEAMQAWHHLSLAEMTNTIYDGTELPQSSIRNASYRFESLHFAFTSNLLMLSSTDVTYGTGVITPSQALAIDQKSDDGLPLLGNIRGALDLTNSDPTVNEDCLVTAFDDTGSAANLVIYDIASEEVACAIGFAVDLD